MSQAMNEFKKFIFRGNVVDMAVGVIIGGAFGKIVTSLVNDMMMPPIGWLLRDVDFTNLFLTLNGQVYASLTDAQKAGAPTMNYGIFLNTVINFVIVAFAIFMMMKVLNSAKKKEDAIAAVPSAPPRQEVLLEEIRNLLATK